MNNIQISVTLCCGKGGCPVVKKDDAGDVVITDDYKGRVKLSKEEWEMLKEIVKDGDI